MLGLGYIIVEISDDIFLISHFMPLFLLLSLHHAFHITDFVFVWASGAAVLH